MEFNHFYSSILHTGRHKFPQPADPPISRSSAPVVVHADGLDGGGRTVPDCLPAVIPKFPS